MEVSQWFTVHWFELTETLSVVGSLLFTAHRIREDAKARQVSNLIAIKQQHDHIWDGFEGNPALERVLKPDADVSKEPVSDQERNFVKKLILHLDTVHHALKAGAIVKLQGLEKDIRDFFSRPVPRATWEKLKHFHSTEFVNFVDEAVGES